MTFRTRTLEFLPCPSKFLFFVTNPLLGLLPASLPVWVTSGQSHFRCSYDPWLIFLSFQFSRIFIFLYFSIFVFLRSVTDFNNEIYYYYIRTRKFSTPETRNQISLYLGWISKNFKIFIFEGKSYLGPNMIVLEEFETKLFSLKILLFFLIFPQK